jgi:hypothetical protein
MVHDRESWAGEDYSDDYEHRYPANERIDADRANGAAA